MSANNIFFRHKVTPLLKCPSRHAGGLCVPAALESRGCDSRKSPSVSENNARTEQLSRNNQRARTRRIRRKGREVWHGGRETWTRAAAQVRTPVTGGDGDAARGCDCASQRDRRGSGAGDRRRGAAPPAAPGGKAPRRTGKLRQSLRDRRPTRQGAQTAGRRAARADWRQPCPHFARTSPLYPATRARHPRRARSRRCGPAGAPHIRSRGRDPAACAGIDIGERTIIVLEAKRPRRSH
jgi:hypothetical protein